MEPVKIKGSSIHDVIIDTDVWLRRAATVDKRAQDAIDAFVGRRARRRAAAGLRAWYSDENKQDTIGDYLVRLFDRFERIDAIRRGADPTRAKRWRHETVACSSNTASDLSDDVLISIVAPVESADSIYCNEAVWLVARCEYYWSDIPRAYDADVERGILDFVLGWTAVFINKDRCERISERASIGYASNPTNELGDLLGKSPTRLARDGAHILARDPESGRTVRLYPYSRGL